MQKFIDQLTESDRRVVRKWRLVTVAFYGSILAGMAVQDPNLRIVGPSLEPEPYGIGINKAQDDLVRAVNASLERIRRDGTWLTLYRKWLNVLGPAPRPPEPKYRD